MSRSSEICFTASVELRRGTCSWRPSDVIHGLRTGPYLALRIGAFTAQAVEMGDGSFRLCGCGADPSVSHRGIDATRKAFETWVAEEMRPFVRVESPKPPPFRNPPPKPARRPGFWRDLCICLALALAATIWKWWSA